jgi:hypothetical protein
MPRIAAGGVSAPLPPSFSLIRDRVTAGACPPGIWLLRFCPVAQQHAADVCLPLNAA